MMKKLLILVAVSLMAGSAMAETVNVFGYAWDGLDGPDNAYTVNSPTSVTITTDFVTGSSMKLAGISSLINVGTEVSYDRYISGGTYLYYYQNQALDATDVAMNYYQDYAQDQAAGQENTTYLPVLVNPAVHTPTPNDTGVNVHILYDSATTYVATYTDILTDTIIASGSIAINIHGTPGDDIDAIDGWLIKNWVSDYAVTIENFKIVPEPATMAILGLGGLLIRRRKR